MKYKKGNLLDVTEGIILHGCNSQGVMGSGVAAQIKKKYPEAYYTYLQDYQHGLLKLGYISTDTVSSDLVIVSAITQDSYGRDPNILYVNYGAIGKVIQATLEFWPDHTINIPKIGAGLGNGDWPTIEKIIDAITDNVICWEL